MYLEDRSTRSPSAHPSQRGCFSFLGRDVIIPAEIEYDGAKMAVLIDIEWPRLEAEKTIFEGTWAGEIKFIVVKQETWSRRGEGSRN